MNARLYTLPGQPAGYFQARLTPTGWAVGHRTPGTVDGITLDVDGFHTQESAEREAAWMNRDREQQLARERHETVLLGQRQVLPRGVWA